MIEKFQHSAVPDLSLALARSLSLARALSRFHQKDLVFLCCRKTFGTFLPMRARNAPSLLYVDKHVMEYVCISDIGVNSDTGF